MENTCNAIGQGVGKQCPCGHRGGYITENLKETSNEVEKTERVKFDIIDKADYGSTGTTTTQRSNR